MSIFSKVRQCTGSFKCRFRTAMLFSAAVVVIVFVGVVLFAR